MKNKSGKVQTGTVIIILAALVVIYALNVGNVQSLFNGTGGTQTATTTPGCSGSNPSLNVLGTDALVGNQNVSSFSSYNYKVNGKYIGTAYANPALNDVVDFIAVPSSNYLPTEVMDTIACGPNNIPATFYAYTNATVTIYNDAGTNVLTNSAAGGVVNETAITSGGTKNWRVHIVGTNQKSTGKMFFYVELPSGSASNVSNVVLNPSGSAPSATNAIIPSYISSTNTNPFKIAFEIPSVNNGAVVDYYLQANLLATKTLAGTTYTKIFSEQMFADVDGTFKAGIYDQLGNAKFHDSYSYNFMLV
jgi:hypothetical protein